MGNLGIKEWLNENSNGLYPFSSAIKFKDLIVDASFIQFNNFIPILKSVEVLTDLIKFEIQFYNQIIIVPLAREDYFYGVGIRIYSTNPTLYFGVIVVGSGVITLMDNYLNQKVKLNIPFSANTVCPVEESSGVYSINNIIGDVIFEHHSSELNKPKTVKYSIDDQTIIFNASGIPDINNYVFLKKLNNKSATNNSITLSDAEVLKIEPTFEGIRFSLANSVLNDKIAPKKHYA